MAAVLSFLVIIYEELLVIIMKVVWEWILVDAISMITLIVC